MPPPFASGSLASSYTRPPYPGPGVTSRAHILHHSIICAHSRCLRSFANPYITLPHLIACADSRCLRSSTTLATTHRGVFLAWGHSLDPAVIHLTRVAGVTCHAEPSLLTLRSLPERQPAGPFGKRSFVNPSKVQGSVKERYTQRSPGAPPGPSC